MKKYLCILFLLLLPFSVLAEAPAAPVNNVLIHRTPGQISVLRHIDLPDGGILLDGCIQADFDRVGPGDWSHLYLMRVDAQGKPLWMTRYASFTGRFIYDKSVLSLDRDGVTVMHFSNLLGNEHCDLTEMRFDLSTGKQLDGLDTISIPVEEVPSVTHTGDFRITSYYNDYNDSTVCTTITFIPTGQTAEYHFSGLQHVAAFGDKLICFFVDTQDRAYFDVYGADCLLVTESIPFAPDCTPFVGHTVLTGDKLSIFAWTNRETPDQRTYTLFQLDKEMRISEALTSFTLADGHSLGRIAPCGDGFLLTDLMPWEWGVITTCDLLHLSMDGTLTKLLPDLPEQRSTITLLPGANRNEARVILCDEAGSSLYQTTYADQ